MREQAKRHPRHALTVRTVQAFIAKGKTRRLADGGGLYIVAAPGGSTSWVLRTVVRGKRCDLGLGSATVVSLAEAREAAHSLRKIARAGGDPMAERRQLRRETPTFESAATQVHAAHSKAFKNKKHSKQWLSSLQPVFSAFGNKRVDVITSADVLAAVTPRWLSHPETSRRVLQRIKVVLDWSKAQGFCGGDNPTVGITKVLPKQKASKVHHASLPYQQVPSFISDLRTTAASEAVRLAFEFTILCATRTTETLNARWDEIDFGTKSWAIPAARMKTGRDHRVPFSVRAVEILERAKALSDGGPYVFPGRYPKLRCRTWCS